MDVKPKDRKQETEYLRMALNMAELGVSYTQADLILKAVNEVQRKGGNFTISDGVDLYTRWRKEWDNYFEKQKKP